MCVYICVTSSLWQANTTPHWLSEDHWRQYRSGPFHPLASAAECGWTTRRRHGDRGPLDHDCGSRRKKWWNCSVKWHCSGNCAPTVTWMSPVTCFHADIHFPLCCWFAGLHGTYWRSNLVGLSCSCCLSPHSPRLRQPQPHRLQQWHRLDQTAKGDHIQLIRYAHMFASTGRLIRHWHDGVKNTPVMFYFTMLCNSLFIWRAFIFLNSAILLFFTLVLVFPLDVPTCESCPAFRQDNLIFFFLLSSP